MKLKKLGILMKLKQGQNSLPLSLSIRRLSINTNKCLSIFFSRIMIPKTMEQSISTAFYLKATTLILMIEMAFPLIIL